MSMNWTTFRTRTMTAVVFVIIMLLGMLWNEWSFFVLFSIIHAGCWIEYHRLNQKILPSYINLHALYRAGLLFIGWGFCFWMYRSAITHELFAKTGILLLAAGSFALITGTLLSLKAGIKSLAAGFIGLLYLSISFALLMHLRSGVISSDVLPAVKWLPLLLIGAIWINDTMAYIVGSFIGKTPLSPISPKKTWEGTIGGIILSVAIGAISGFCFFSPEAGKHFAFIAFIASVTGTLGDLLESKLKRMAGVKDSGHFMPGHGGFLDRFDSLLLAAPFVWVYIWLMA